MKVRVKPSGQVAFVGNMRIDSEQEVEYTPEVARKIKDGEVVEVAKAVKVEPTNPKVNPSGQGGKV